MEIFLSVSTVTSFGYTAVRPIHPQKCLSVPFTTLALICVPSERLVCPVHGCDRLEIHAVFIFADFSPSAMQTPREDRVVHDVPFSFPGAEGQRSWECVSSVSALRSATNPNRRTDEVHT